MRRSTIAGVVLMLAGPARATDLSGFYILAQTPYQSNAESYCLKLVSGGASGIYADQGAALMLSTSNSQVHFEYLGQYQLYQNHFSLVVGNYGRYARYWFLMTANVKNGQWTDGLFYDYNIFSGQKKKDSGGYNGTFTATAVKGSCK